ncbi:hypothetical protein [Janibacter sp. GS2]|uniref:hypothetical protein n=1 Tax=Janibacter sp. GS2 TaxID=3442646 RepID=UPI003EBB8822
MGLSTWTARRAARSAHVLVVEVPGNWMTRVCTERAVRERGWHVALSPADADLLVVCGTPGAQLAPFVDRVWEQMPGPRARSEITDPLGVLPALTRAQDDLLDRDQQREDARERATEPDLDHGEMDHGDMDMAPGGIALAEGGEDRDGLEMDVLHLPLGPILAHWPAGLVLRCSLQGDVIVDAEARWVRGGVPGEDALGAAPGAAIRVDNVAALLTLAGWPDAAVRARRLRDDLLRAEDPHELRAELGALHRRVARSRLLRWSLRRIRPIGAEELAERAWPHAWAGDVHDRLLTMLERAAASLRAAPGDPDDAAGGDAAAALPHLVSGLDLATARLVVASLDLDPLGTAEVQRA